MERNETIVRTATPQPADMPRLKVTIAEITEVKRQFILENILLSGAEVAAILNVSERTVDELRNSGQIIAANKAAADKKKSATKGIRYTPESVQNYRKSILVPPEFWSK